MQIGVVYPQIELRGDPGAVRRIGRAVEDLGFDHLMAYDHVLGAVHSDRTPQLTGPYTERDPFHDPFVMVSYLAAITERISFVTGILVPPQRQTALVARQAADVCHERGPVDPVVLPPGGAGDVTSEIAAWREAGGTHASLVTMGRGLDSVDTHIDYLASVAAVLNLS